MASFLRSSSRLLQASLSSSTLRPLARQTVNAPVALFSTYPDDRKYAKSHEWLKVEDDVATVGISDFAQSQLGDIVHVELPEVGADAVKGESAVTLESVKATADVYAPVSGEVVEVNDQLSETPDLITDDPHAGGWMFKVKMSDSAEADTLLSSSEYEGVVDEDQH